MGDLSANYSTWEFEKIRPVPAQFRANIPKLAALCQLFHDAVGARTGLPGSVYRDPAANAAAGSTNRSQHLRAEAVDIVFPGVPNEDIISAALAIRAKGGPIPFGQVIVYDLSPHTHLSLPTLGARNGEIKRKRALDGELVDVHSVSELPPFMRRGALHPRPGGDNLRCTVCARVFSSAGEVT